MKRIDLSWRVISVLLVLALAVPWAVLADNVQDELSGAATTVTIEAGDSTSIDYWIVANGPDGCNVDEDNPATVTIVVNADVTRDPATLVFMKCASGAEKNEQTVQYSSLVAGTYPISVSVSGGKAGNNGWNTNAAEATLVVTGPSDTTPPVISYELTPASPDGENDWYVSHVFVDWTVSDPESNITSMTGCDDVTVDYDTTGVTLICTATSAGGTASESVMIKRDATKPTIDASVSPDAANSGWWNSDTGAPTVSFDCDDTTSGIATCPADYTFPEGEDLSYTGTAYDNAGNSASASVDDIDVDVTAPGITWNSLIEDGDSFYFGAVPAEPTCDATDALSGPYSCSVSGYSALVGEHTLTATAYDVAGNKREETRDYTVQAWTLNGFYRPVDMEALNTVKGGSTVPLKFNVWAGATELTETSVVMSFTTKQVTCGTVDGIEEPVEVTATGGTFLRYDFVDGQFVQNWQTPKKPGTCWIVTMTTQDGSSLEANFKLK